MTIYETTTRTTTDGAAWSETAIDTCEAFWAAVTDHDGPSAISFDRCVDWLLDLYHLTDDADLRVLITEVLDDLRAIGPVAGDFEDVVLGALASVEIAFEVVHGSDVR